MTSILQLPFYYVTKYGVLLVRLKKESDQLAKNSHRSVARLLSSIQKATRLVEEFLRFTDTCLKTYEGVKAVQQLQKSIRGLPPAWNAAKAGRWIKDGELRTNLGANNYRPAYAFVFEYYMLICRTGNAPQHYELEGTPIELADFTLQSSVSEVQTKEV